MPKKELAVHLYGHLRTFRECAPFLKDHLTSKYDCDLFIHTWDVTEHSTQSWYDPSIKGVALPVDDGVIGEVQNLYKPTGLLIETQGFIFEDGFFGTDEQVKISLQGIHNSLYSMHKSIELGKKHRVQTTTSYEYSVVIRPDILLHEDLKINNYKNEFDFYPSTTIHFVNNTHSIVRDRRFFNYPLASDLFFFGKPHIIDKFTRIEPSFDRYYKDYAKTFPEGIDNPELALFQFLAENSVIPRQYQFYYTLKRTNAKNDIAFRPPAIQALLGTEVVENIHAHSNLQFKKIVKIQINLLWRAIPDRIQLAFLTGLKRLQNYLEYLGQRR